MRFSFVQPFTCGLAVICLLGACNRQSTSEASTASAKTDTARPIAVEVDPIRAAALGQAQVEADLRFLASDDMRGRDTGSPELERAAAYIADVFAKAGAKPLPGQSTMLSPVMLLSEGASKMARLVVGKDTATLAAVELVPLSRLSLDRSATLGYLGAATAEQLSKMSLTGMIVVTEAGGDSIAANPRAYLDATEAKREAVEAAGAVALVEIYRGAFAPFGRLAGALNSDRMRLADAANTPSGKAPSLWLKDGPLAAKLRAPGVGTKVPASLAIEASESKTIQVNNVVAMIPGSDLARAKEVIAVSAHYDHVGVRSMPGQTDSIHNGARDNGMGTAALLQVARAYGSNPQPRPILLLAWTAEEKGLLGSAFFVERTQFPLGEIAFNLNFDGAGYDDTTSVVINGYGKTTAQALIDGAIQSTGLRAQPDPLPEYGLYRQSDNYSMARAGIPAVNIAPGFTGFSEELMKYYHQPPDEVESLNMRYVERYTSVAVQLTRALSNSKDMPAFVAGDEFAGLPKASPK